MKPNVILIECDQMRGDCIGAKGHPVVETPNLDMMTRDGIMFKNAYSAVPTCIAARASIMTGLKPTTHGRVGYKDGIRWDYEHTIASEFSSAGYHTQSIGKMHVHPARNLCGFHNVILHDGYMGYGRNTDMSYQKHWKQTDDYLPWLHDKLGRRADIIDSGLQCNSWVARPWPYSEELHPTNWVVNESIDFLRKKDPDKPFFLKMSFVRPHSPFDPPQVYYDQYINQDIAEAPVGNWVDCDCSEGEEMYIDAKEGYIGERQLKRMRAAYYALITHMDHQIGRFLQVLNEYNELNNTVILFTSDHGDMMGDHNFYRKALPYKGSIDIPFIIYDPGQILDSEKNIIIDNPVELRDIMPTLLDLADLKIPDKVEGKSLLNLLNKQKEKKWRNYIHGEHSYGKKSHHFIVTEEEKYIWYSQTGEEQFFNLNNDPDEINNLAKDKDHEEKVKFYRNILIKELEGRKENYTDGKKLIVGKKPKDYLY